MKKPMTATLDLTALDRTTPAPTSDPIAKERIVTAEVLGRPLRQATLNTMRRAHASRGRAFRI